MLILNIGAGCARGTAESDFCLVAPRITTSSADTEETRAQVDELWAVSDALGCGW
jgi:hypothetical protein